MHSYRGEDLKQFLDSKTSQLFLQKRDIYSELEYYLNAGQDSRICCLFGLRRTGKTVMMLQSVKDREEFINDILYIQCEKTDNMQDLKNVLSENKDAKYIYIDEAAKIQDFVLTCSILPDIYKTDNNRIVVSATDSLGLKIAEADELYDRCHLIHTTYIPYREYCRLLGKNIMEYMAYGGTLTDGTVFYNKDELDKYTNTAIVDNIRHTAKQITIPELEPMIKNGLLESSIKRLIEKYSHDFILDTLNNKFKSHDLGSLSQLIHIKNIKGMKDVPTTEAPLQSDNIQSAVMFYLGIRNSQIIFTEKELHALTNLLEKMDVIEPDGEGGYYFIQPGMRHCQIEQILKGMSADKEFQNYSPEEKDWINNTLREDIEGKLLEEIIISECSKNPEITDKYDVFKFRNITNREYDVVLSDRQTKKAVVIEIKRTKLKSGEQKKNLLNKELVEDIKKEKGCEVSHRVILYNGETDKAPDKDGILYINASSFLQEPMFCISMIENIWEPERIPERPRYTDDREIKGKIQEILSSSLPDVSKRKEISEILPLTVWGKSEKEKALLKLPEIPLEKPYIFSDAMEDHSKMNFTTSRVSPNNIIR